MCPNEINKTCRSCEKNLPLSDFPSSGGRRCKACHRDCCNNYRITNPDHVKELERKRYWRNHNKSLEKNNRYRAANLERCKENVRKAAKSHRESIGVQYVEKRIAHAFEISFQELRNLPNYKNIISAKQLQLKLKNVIKNGIENKSDGLQHSN